MKYSASGSMLCIALYGYRCNFCVYVLTLFYYFLFFLIVCVCVCCYHSMVNKDVYIKAISPWIRINRLIDDAVEPLLDCRLCFD